MKAGIRYRYEISVADLAGNVHDEGGDRRATAAEEHVPPRARRRAPS